MTSTPPQNQETPLDGTLPALPLKPPNQKALDVMKAIEAIHATMNPKPGRSSVELVREAREGAMYG